MNLIKTILSRRPEELFYLRIDTRSDDDQIKFELDHRNALNLGLYALKRLEYERFTNISPIN